MQKPTMEDKLVFAKIIAVARKSLHDFPEMPPKVQHCIDYPFAEFLVKQAKRRKPKGANT